MVVSLFPTCAYQIDDYRLDSKNEKNLIDECYNNNNENYSGNLISTNTYILNEEYMADAKNYFSEQINIFAHDILLIKPTLKFYITQSWLNINKTNTSHHKHFHRNSFISGIYYLTDGPPVTFYKKNDIMQNFDFDFKEFNQFNMESVEAEIKKGRLILFPSILEHEVKKNLNNDTRISLSFNTFFKGDLKNDNTRSTSLKIM